jgi:APA family basic amino acid/polyamine antiporter
VVAAMTLLCAGGLRRSSRANAAIVAVTVAALVAFVAAGASTAAGAAARFDAPLANGAAGLLHATALAFVAFTGYGRIATLGEEVRDPARTIPRAILVTTVASALLYLAVAAVAVGVLGAGELGAVASAVAAPLEVAARATPVPGIRTAIAIGAITAMLGVLLDLILGLSRVALAMARRGDAPAPLVTVSGGSPRAAVFAAGGGILVLVAIGEVGVTWSFSAFAVLVYYAITNLAALRLPAEHRRLPRAVAALGLVSCLALAPWVDLAVWATGLGLIAVGLLWHAVARALANRRT